MGEGVRVLLVSNYQRQRCLKLTPNRGIQCAPLTKQSCISQTWRFSPHLSSDAARVSVLFWRNNSKRSPYHFPETEPNFKTIRSSMCATRETFVKQTFHDRLWNFQSNSCDGWTRRISVFSVTTPFPYIPIFSKLSFLIGEKNILFLFQVIIFLNCCVYPS